MNISNKSILAGTLLVALFAGTSANAQGGRADSSSIYSDNSAKTVEVKKVSVKSTSPIFVGVNR